MVMLSAHLAALACLCAALPLAVPARAAHVPRDHSVGQHGSAPGSQQRTYGASSLGGINGKSSGRRIRANWAPELPPLLRRHYVHDPKKTLNHHNQEHHDGTHHEVPRSAFARSRYRREPVRFGRRSSVYFPGENGDMYMVSHTPSASRERGGMGNGRRSSHTHVPRQGDESSLVLGRIDIMVDIQPAGKTQRLASLTVDSSPIDWTSGQSSAKAFQLNASTTNQTQFIMLPARDSLNAAEGPNKRVTLSTEVFDPNSAEMVMYCATYDPDPGAKSALVMTPCSTQPVAQLGDTDPCTDDGDEASTLIPHESQLFSYDPSTGQVGPIAATPIAPGTRRSDDGLTACADARVRRDGGGSSMTSTSASASSTSTSATPLPSDILTQARNVTLVYVATALQVPASSSNANTTDNSAPVSTTTITTTVVETVSASGVSTSGDTTTPPRAAATQATTSATTTATPKTPVNAEESLEVEIVGVTPTVTSSSSTTATTATTRATSPSSVSMSLDPQAVASLIANSGGRRRGVVAPVM